MKSASDEDASDESASDENRSDENGCGENGSDGAPLQWIFGYGSLIWRPAFPYAERRRASISGWTRRFWQGSTDHRGVPGAPGRVVTLVAERGATCWGVAFRLRAEDRERVLSQLDRREQGGYDRLLVETDLHPDPSERRRSSPRRSERVTSLLYIANDTNPNYLGPASAPRIAEQVRRSHGPSGSNLEYVVALHGALRELGVVDPHVSEIAAELALAVARS